MTATPHVARVAGSASTDWPPYRVDLRVGGHALVADEPAASGGGDAGPSPFGSLLSGPAACTAITLRTYAQRKGWSLATIEVDVRYDVADNQNPSIHRTITLAAYLPIEQRDRLDDIADRTPATVAVGAGPPTTVLRVEPQIKTGSRPGRQEGNL
jgi:putative redox protein